MRKEEFILRLRDAAEVLEGGGSIEVVRDFLQATLKRDSTPQNYDSELVKLELYTREHRNKMARLQAEIRETWSAVRSADGQTEAFRIMERMVDRLGYGRTENNPSLAAAEASTTPQRT